MEYTIRIFSRQAESPTAGDAYAALQRVGCHPAGFRSGDPKDPDWRWFDLEYDGDRCPLRVERSVGDEPGALPDIAQFTRLIGPPGRARKKRQVLDFLAASRQVVALRIPDHVIDEDNWELAHALLRFLQPHLDGMIQADAEGFYDASGKRLIELE